MVHIPLLYRNYIDETKKIQYNDSKVPRKHSCETGAIAEKCQMRRDVSNK